MSRSQWRRHQRIKKVERELATKEIGESSNNQFSSNRMVTDIDPVGRKLFSPRGKDVAKKSPEKQENDEDVMTNDFKPDRNSTLNINFNVVSVLPHEYDQIIEVEEYEEVEVAEMATHKPMCYYVFNNGVVEEQNAFSKGQIRA